MVVEMTHNTAIFSRNRTETEIWNQVRSDYRKSKEKSSTDFSDRNEAKFDGRKTNRGCDMLHNRSYRKKVEFFDEVLQTINAGVVATTTE